MKNIKYFLTFIFAGLMAVSCIDDTALEDSFGNSPNLAAFASTSQNFSVVTTGEEFVQNVPMKVKGPSIDAISGPVTATLSVDPSSTAIEGVHYRLEQNTIEFDPENNLLANFPVTVITEGIDPPLEEAPVLVLNVSDVSGATNTIASGSKISIKLLYLCFSDLAGSYTLTVTRSDGKVYVFDEEIEQTADGEYRTGHVAHYDPADLGGTPGFTFIDVCDEITVPEQNLVDLYGNLVYGINESYSDPEAGTIHIEYEVTFAAGNRQYVAEYVKK